MNEHMSLLILCNQLLYLYWLFARST
uniref:Uncharacterized protein n=1 Tax=Arundo donax TaxID=35708 RepID=A0A0A9B073_ARUDO